MHKHEVNLEIRTNLGTEIKMVVIEASSPMDAAAIAINRFRDIPHRHMAVKGIYPHVEIHTPLKEEKEELTTEDKSKEFLPLKRETLTKKNTNGR